MKARRFKPLVWPAALLIAGGLTAGVAELSAMSVETITRYGTIKVVSDLVLLIGVVWCVVAIVALIRAWRFKS